MEKSWTEEFMRFGRSSLMTLVLVLFATVAFAQSSITGEVTDNTGGVLPGVTVEASSPALIEGSRVAVTDRAGRYTVIDLRPGTYTVTMTLPGFSTLVQEDISLPSNFTQLVNGELAVGGLEETITVTGESPVVDVHSARKIDVIPRELHNAIPTSRRTATTGMFAQGVRMSGPDVGGQIAGIENKLNARGAGTRHNTLMIDGQQVNTASCDYCAGTSVNPAIATEITISTGASPPEVHAGGIVLNLIPKDGGNTTSGSLYAGFTRGPLNTGNVDDRLRSLGVTAGSTLEYLADLNPSVGGPILRDRLWYFLSAEILESHEAVQGSFFPNDDSVPADLRGKQGVQEGFDRSVDLRLTAQITPRNKVSAFMDRTFPFRGRSLKGNIFEDSFIEPVRASRHTDWRRTHRSWGQAKWTSTLSSRALLEVAYTQVKGTILLGQQVSGPPTRRSGAGIDLNVPIPNDLITCVLTPCYHPLSYDQTRPWFVNGVRHEDQLTRQRWNAHGENFYITPVSTWLPAVSLSYVTGSHNFKTGIQYQKAHGGTTREYGGHMRQVYRDGVPSFARIHNSPSAAATRNTSPAIYVQDAWTRDRLTLSGGLRFDWMDSTNDMGGAGDGVPAGRFVRARAFPPTEVKPSWKDLSPRFNVVYDLFGDGRTAAKFSVNRYTRRYVAGFAGRFHPISNFADENRSWFDCVLHPRVHDPGATVSRADCATAAELTAAGLSAAYLNTNGDDIAQDHEVGLVRNTAVFNDAGGIPIVGRRPDPDIEREWNLEWTASVQHEIAPRISVTAAYYRRNFYDIPGSRNLALNECSAPQLATPGVPCGDWTPFNVTFDDPLGRVPHLAGQTILVFNQDPATRGVAPDRVDQNLDTMTLTYNAVELSFNARLPNGGTLFGGWTGAQHVENTCGALDNPNGQNVAPMISGEGSQIMGGRFCDKGALGIPFRHDFKMWGVYPLPYDVTISGGIQLYSGNERQITWLVPASLYPNGQRTSPTRVSLNEPGTEYTEYWQQVDLQIRKGFRAGPYEYSGQIEIHNLLNDNSVLREIVQYGSRTLNPLAIIRGRVVKFAVQVNW